MGIHRTDTFTATLVTVMCSQVGEMHVGDDVWQGKCSVGQTESADGRRRFLSDGANRVQITTMSFPDRRCFRFAE